MATIKEQVDKIMCYADTTEDKILALESSDYFKALKAVERIKDSLSTLESLGLMEDTHGCGGCETAIAECVKEDEIPCVPAEAVWAFLDALFEGEEEDWE